MNSPALNRLLPALLLAGALACPLAPTPIPGSSAAPVASAQEFPPAAPARGQAADAAADAADDAGDGTSATESSSTRTEAPNTDGCPQSLIPPAPVDTSEALAPGAASPTPLPPTPTENCGLSLPGGFRVDPSVLAAAWMVTDVDTGEIVAMKDPHGRYRPASIIKALLALVAIDELDLQRTVVVTEEDANMEGSAVGIGAGGTYTVEQLLQGLILASGNDAAHALATVLGGEEATLTKVNKLARDLGTTDTVAASYTGLDAPGMSTSAWDIALIYEAAFRNPTFARLASTEKVDFPGYAENPGYQLWNDNGLFMNDPDGIGGKTGYTDDAHHTFVGALNRDGRRLMAVILNTTVEHGPRAWQQAQSLLHEAYRVDGDGRHGVGQLTALGAGASASNTTAAASATGSAAAADAATAATAATATASDAASGSAAHKGGDSALEDIEPWVKWLVVGIIGLLVSAATAFSLLRHWRNGRAHRAGRSRE